MTKGELRADMMIICQQFFNEALKEAKEAHTPQSPDTPEVIAATYTEMTVICCVLKWIKALPFCYDSILLDAAAEE